MMNFAQAQDTGMSFELIPDGTLVWGWLSFKDINSPLTKSQSSTSVYLDMTLTVDEGQPFQRRKIFFKIGDPFNAGNSEKYRQMGQTFIKRILEAGRGAGPHNPGGYQLTDYGQISGLRVPVRVGVEKGSDQYPDAKNGIKEILSPNPESEGYKGYQMLMAGDHNIKAAKPAAPAAANGFGAAPAGNPFGNAPAARPAAAPANQFATSAPTGWLAAGQGQPAPAAAAPAPAAPVGFGAPAAAPAGVTAPAGFAPPAQPAGIQPNQPPANVLANGPDIPF